MIDSPGVYPDLDEAEYHADPVPAGSLSVTWAKKLLKPGGPARFHWERQHGSPVTAALDFGKVAHALVLGVGADYEVLPTDDLRNRETREADAEFRAAGKVPIKPREWAQVKAMTKALIANREALMALSGTPEVSMFRLDPETGVMLRGRADCVGPEGIADYKTTAKYADPWAFAGDAARLGYHQQDAWYLDMRDSLDIDCPPRFRFVVQEKTPPYPVCVIELDPQFRDIGRRANRQAIDIYRACVDADDWPAYEPRTHLVGPPAWLARQDAESLDPHLEAELIDMIGAPS